jgi:hypothetical protein
VQLDGKDEQDVGELHCDGRLVSDGNARESNELRRFDINVGSGETLCRQLFSIGVG